MHEASGWLVALLVFVAATVLGGWAVWRLRLAYAHYHRDFKQATQLGLREFFLFVDPSQVWLAQWVICAVLGALTWHFSERLTVAVLVMAVMLALPHYGLRMLRQRRMAQFERQLPNFLMSVAAALRAGSGLQVAVRQIVQQSPTPLAQELGLMLQEQRMGLSFDEALVSLAARIPSQGTALLVSALRVAMLSGGNLSDTLERIATTLRARLYMQGRILALTSQGRMQAWVMSALPLLLALVLDYLDPESMALLWHTPMGWIVMGAVLVLEGCGLWLIRRIVAIEV